jgi:hypothetical protein
MYKIVVEFNQLNILAINADEPSVAAKNTNKLFVQGRAKAQIKSIKVYLQEDDLEFALPIHTLKFS